MNEFLLNHISTIATPFLVASYVPQLIKTYRTKDVTGVSVPFWILINVSLTMLLVNSIAIFMEHGEYGYMIAEIANESLAFAMLVMVLRYRNRKPRIKVNITEVPK
ncbi:PQ loop repeat protein [Sporosarcina phage Lietuvens]|nr:PQ loop repeat protein [Sporosarcina phage Lietuvens]